MAECNNRPIPGTNQYPSNGFRGDRPSDHRSGDGRRIPSHWSAEEDRRAPRDRQPTNHRTGSRGYRTDGHSAPPSRWNNSNNNSRDYNDSNGRHQDGYNANDRSRGGRAADNAIDSHNRSGMNRNSRMVDRDDDGYESFRDRSSGGRAAENDTADHHRRHPRTNGAGERPKDHDRSQHQEQRAPRFRDRSSSNRRHDDEFEDHRHTRGPRHRSSRQNENRGRTDGHSSEHRRRDRSREGRDSFGRRERSRSGDFSDGYGDSRRESRRRYPDRSGRDDRQEDRRRRPRHSSDDDSSDGRGDDAPSKTRKPPQEPKEWPPCFQNSESSFTFDARSAMFYEPLSDFFYDPKSKLYYGNKKHAYFRYDDQQKPPFVEVHKMSAEQVEERNRGDASGIAQEKVVPDHSAPKLPGPPKIAIKFKTKKVKSSKLEAATLPQPAASTVSKVKQEQIANIGKWNVKQAELKQQQSGLDPKTATPVPSSLPKKKPTIRTTPKGEPICMLCKRKFPNLAKLKLHIKASELHKTNLQKLREKKKQQQAAGTKRNADEITTTKEAAPAYTDRAEKRRQLHGVDVCAPPGGLRLLEQLEPNKDRDPGPNDVVPAADNLLDESNVGHKLLQKMGYKADDRTKNSNDSSKPKTADEHLRKEWDRIEAMAQKSVPRNR